MTSPVTVSYEAQDRLIIFDQQSNQDLSVPSNPLQAVLDAMNLIAQTYHQYNGTQEVIVLASTDISRLCISNGDYFQLELSSALRKRGYWDAKITADVAPTSSSAQRTAHVVYNIKR